MPTEAIIKQHLWSDKVLIAIANAMSEDIDLASLDTASSLEPRDRQKIHDDMTSAFMAVCFFLEERGITVSDHVVCPKEW
jgi:hypothetical protein